MIAIINNGSQYTHLIWRTIRDLGYEGKIFSNKVKFEEIKNAQVFILSGGPGSAYKNNLGVCKEIIIKAVSDEIDKPILGICLGHQLIAHYLGGEVMRGTSAEYGIMRVCVDNKNELFKGMPKEFNAWMNHFDEVKKIPENFVGIAHSKICKYEGMAHKNKKIYGVQFHPEVWHTENGDKILQNIIQLSE